MSDVKTASRWIVVVGALLIQLSLGAIYTWGTFVPTLEASKAKLVASYSSKLLDLDAETAEELSVLKKAAADAKMAANASPSTDADAAKKAATDELTAFCKKVVPTISDEIWSKHYFGFSATETSIIFSAGLATFAFVMIMAGRWQDKVGPRKVALIGGVVLGIGYIAAGFTGTSFWSMFFLIGIVGGAGIGLGYVCPIAACVKWFPDMKGFITGMAVAGFGAGAFVFIKLAGAWANLIANAGINGTFLVFGVIFLISVVAGALMLSNPPAGWKPAGWEPPIAKSGAAMAKVADLTQGQCVQTARFWMIWLAFVFSAGCGLMVIKCLKNFGINEGGLSAAVAGSALGYLALFNGLGRIAWGTASQKLSARGALILMTLLQGLMMFGLLAMGSNAVTLGVAACWIGFNFGGNFALFPLLTAESFGTKNLGANYGAVFTAYGVGGIAGPMLAGGVWDHLGSYEYAFIPAGIACLLAMGLAILLQQCPPSNRNRCRA